jgi:two-component system, response regulator YesN
MLQIMRRQIIMMYSVLIVDDMEAIRNMIKRLPIWGDVSGFVIKAEAKDGEEALELFKEHDFDLVISDIRMPKVDGMELIKELKEVSPDTITVLLTDHAEFTFAKEAIKYGVLDYLVKPVEKDALDKVLVKAREILEQRKKQLKFYYPEKYVFEASKKICLGDSKGIEEIIAIEETIKLRTKDNPTNTDILLEKLEKDVKEMVIAEHSWLKYFLGMKYDYKLDAWLMYVLGELDEFTAINSKNQYVRRIASYLLDNIETEISMNDLADKLYLSKNYLGELFKQETGISVAEFFNRAKVRRAGVLLLESDLKWYEIAVKLGFNNIEYFTKIFKKKMGETPQNYRTRNIKK